MSVIQNNLLLSGDDAYNIQRSLRFRSSASAYLSRTPASAGNQTTWTWSGWLKRGQLGATQRPFFARSGNDACGFGFTSDNLYFVLQDASGVAQGVLQSTDVFRDPSAWYHFVVVMNTTSATSTDRMQLYVNNRRVTAFSTATYPPLNQVGAVNKTLAHGIGLQPTVGEYLDGYLTEINFIDGQALTPSSFGQSSPTTGVWQPKKYTGTYGTNGFYLPFSDNSSLSNLTADRSGNGNNWTANNISLTAGATYDSMTDVPTLTSATQANFATWNPLDSGGITFSNANLQVANAAASFLGCRAGIALPTTGKIYFEFSVTQNSSASNITNVGISQAVTPLTGNQNGATNTAAWYFNQNQSVLPGVTPVSGGATTSDVYQVAFDCDTGNYYLGRNNVFYNSSGASTGNPSGGTNQTGTLTNNGALFPWAFGYANGAIANFGQRPFAYTPPTGFVALNTFNLPTPTIGATASTQANKYMDISLYTGNGSTQSITNSGGFQPDFVWGKARSAAYGNWLFDVIRGATKYIGSESTSQELTISDSVTSFNSNGFSVGANNGFNQNGVTFVGWQWKANGTGVTNTAGSITSTVSANTSSGFSIVTYTANGASAQTIGHGLGVAPAMIITKCRSAGSSNWGVYHRSLGNTGGLFLNTTNAFTTQILLWNNTSPTSTVFSVGTNNTDTNFNTNTMVAYCFAEVAGFSRFGSYTGNGSTDGPFVFTGFRPRYVLCKRTDAVSNWNIVDAARTPNNPSDVMLLANATNSELSSFPVDFLSNGFKMRNTEGGYNTSGGTYIFMAFAENPFKYSLAR